MKTSRPIRRIELALPNASPAFAAQTPILLFARVNSLYLCRCFNTHKFVEITLLSRKSAAIHHNLLLLCEIQKFKLIKSYDTRQLMDGKYSTCHLNIWHYLEWNVIDFSLILLQKTILCLIFQSHIFQNLQWNGSMIGRACILNSEWIRYTYLTIWPDLTDCNDVGFDELWRFIFHWISNVFLFHAIDRCHKSTSLGFKLARSLQQQVLKNVKTLTLIFRLSKQIPFLRTLSAADVQRVTTVCCCCISFVAVATVTWWVSFAADQTTVSFPLRFHRSLHEGPKNSFEQQLDVAKRFTNVYDLLNNISTTQVTTITTLSAMIIIATLVGGIGLTTIYIKSDRDR